MTLKSQTYFNMKKVLFAAFLFISVAVVSCKTTDTMMPEEVLSNFFDALGKKNIEKAKTLSTPDSKMVLDMLESAIKMDTSAMNMYDKNTMKFGVPKIEGDAASVPVTETKSGAVVNYKLKKIDGAWKVAFDKASLMQTGMEAAGDNKDFMNEIGDTSDIEQRMKEGKQELEKMNMDSLKRELEKSLNQ